jgi:hypothetical protein
MIMFYIMVNSVTRTIDGKSLSLAYSYEFPSEVLGLAVVCSLRQAFNPVMTMPSTKYFCPIR